VEINESTNPDMFSLLCAKTYQHGVRSDSDFVESSISCVVSAVSRNRIVLKILLKYMYKWNSVSIPDNTNKASFAVVISLEVKNVL